MKLNVKALALTSGLIWGFGLFLITFWIILFDGTSGDVTFIGHIYRGYNISFSGALIGLVWAFFDGAIGGAVFACLYNWLNGKFKTE